jgi:hypothetical protein
MSGTTLLPSSVAPDGVHDVDGHTVIIQGSPHIQAHRRSAILHVRWVSGFPLAPTELNRAILLLSWATAKGNIYPDVSGDERKR